VIYTDVDGTVLVHLPQSIFLGQIIVQIFHTSVSWVRAGVEIEIAGESGTVHLDTVLIGTRVRCGRVGVSRSGHRMSRISCGLGGSGGRFGY